MMDWWINLMVFILVLVMIFYLLNRQEYLPENIKKEQERELEDLREFFRGPRH
jgi:hypothetical protein